jgi:HlyD family secretion protein
MRSWRHVAVAIVAVAMLGCGGSRPDDPPAAAAVDHGPFGVTALGRISPKDGIRRIAGPSRPSVVIAKLLVDEGDRVEAGQAIAMLDTQAEDAARLARTNAELTNAQTELGRLEPLLRQGMASASLWDAAKLKVEVARAEMAVAQSAAELDTVRAPVSGQIVKIHARRGERVGPDGIAEMAEIDHMYAVAEVYETDIGRVRVGQHATMHTPALEQDLAGSVERIGLKVGQLDLLATDPSARTDARIVEVWIRLDDGARAAPLSNLQVEVAIATQ